MTEREREAIDLLRRIYEKDSQGHYMVDDGMVVEWADNEIAAFIRKYGAFADQLREAREESQ